MGAIARMIWRRRGKLVVAALDAAKVRGEPVSVVDCPPLAELLAEGGHVIATDGALGALVVARDAPSPEELARWIAAVRDGGAIVLVGSGAREETMRRVLCAGLVELEQRTPGRAVVTSGRTRSLA